MKLQKNQQIAVVIAICVVGFFFVFGQTVMEYFTNQINGSTDTQMNTQQALQIDDAVIGMGDEAVAGNRVTVHYTGTFTDGTVFDSSVSRGEPIQFVLGAGEVIEGWDKGLVGMKVGGKRTLTVPPEMGYGMDDYGPIPGGSVLTFTVELLKVER